MSNKEMTATEERKKAAPVPRARFPGFDGEWTLSPVSEIYTFKGNNSLSRDKLNYNGGSFRNIHYGDIHKSFKRHFFANSESVPYINDGEANSAIKPENYCAPGDIVFADASEDAADIGKAIEIIDAGDVPLVAGLHTILAKPKTNAVAVGFGAYLFASESVRRQIQHEAQGTKVLGLSASRLEKVFLAYPKTVNEQLKITGCLSSLDVLIEAKEGKLHALRTHKSGLVQQLFPRRAETTPRLRFPKFTKAKAWPKTFAGRVFLNRIERGEPGLPIYSVTTTDGLVPRASLDRKIDDLAETSANKTVREGDLAYNMMRMWQGALGIAPEDCLVSPAYIVLEPQEVNPLFFYHLFKQPFMLQTLTAHSRGLTEDRLRLYYDDFAKISVPCPSRAEQDQIAELLSSVDRKIFEQEQELRFLKTHRGGMTQRLFPAPIERQA